MRTKKPLSPEAQYVNQFYERQQAMPKVEVRISQERLSMLSEIGNDVLWNRASMAEKFLDAAIEMAHDMWKGWKAIPYEVRPPFSEYAEKELYEDETAAA